MKSVFSTIKTFFYSISKRPIVPIAFSTVLGVLLADRLPDPPGSLLIAAAAGSALAFGLALFLAWRRLGPAAYLLVILAFPAVIYALSAPRLGVPSRIPAELSGIEARHRGVIAGEPAARNGRLRAIADLGLLKAMLYWEGQSTTLSPGDRVIFTCALEPPPRLRAPGTRDPAREMERIGVSAVCGLRSPPIRVTGGGAGPGAPSIVKPVRGAVDSWLASPSDTPGRSILRALVTGNMDGISQDARNAFARSGTSHILSISGLHTTIVAQLFFLLICSAAALFPAVALRANVRRIAAIVSIAFVWYYTFFAGAQIPAVRSAIMTTAYLFAIVIGRDPDLPSSLAVAAVAVLIAFPAELFDISFQLSFASMIGIAAILPAIMPGDEGDPLSVFRTFRPLRWLASLVLMSVSSTLLTAPIVARAFNQVSLVAPIANIPAVPLATFLIVPGGLISSALYFIWPSAASLLAAACSSLCDILWRIAEFFASLPHAYAFISTPTWLEIVAWWCAALSIAIPIRWPRRAAAFAAFAALALLLWQADIRAKNPAGIAAVTFMDVGEGDGALIRTPRGRAILIDAGPLTGTYDAGARIVAPYLYWLRRTGIDVAAITHPHADHMGGMASIIERFRPGEIWTTSKVLASPASKPVLSAAAAAGSRLVTLDALSPGIAMDGMVFTILNPPAGAAELTDNDSSLAIRAAYLYRSFLFPGDAESGGEAAMLSSGIPLRSDVLKVCHQGSGTSTGRDFLASVSPEIAVIPVGVKNRYGFPKAEVLERLLDRGVKVYRTDLDGTIAVTTDGTVLDVKCSAGACR